MSGEKQEVEQLCIIRLVDDFCGQYVPAADEAVADEIFNMARLRMLFCAHVRYGSTQPDPIIPYINRLAAKGFDMKPTFGSGPAILCCSRIRQRRHLEEGPE